MRILLVSYYFPPYNAVGAIRPGKLAAYLNGQGHDVHVLTVDSAPFIVGLPLEIPAGHIKRAHSWSVNAPVEWLRGGRSKIASDGFSAGIAAGSGMGRLGRLYKTLLHWPDAQLGWVGAAVRAGREMMKASRFDLIYVSAPPFSAFRVAAKLARESGCPWIAEMRDLWTDNHSYDHPGWRLAIERAWEARLLSTASAVVTVSPPLAATAAQFGKPVWEIRNGCDPEDFEGLEALPGFGESPDCLDIVFTGNVYDGHYDVTAFCDGLVRFRATGGKFKVHVAGRNVGALRRAATTVGLDPFFDFCATVPRAQALAMQGNADVLLTFLWDNGAVDGIFSTKLFEYVGACRPILAVGERSSDVGRMISDASVGSVVADGEAVARELVRLRALKISQGTLRLPRNPSHDFSRRTQFARLEAHMAALLDEKV